MLKKFLLLLQIVIISPIVCQSIFKQLDRQMESKNSLVCVGLDPDLSKLPNEIMQLSCSPEEKIYKFLCEIINITAPYACSFKIQKAFYDEFANGHALLADVIAYIHESYPGMPAFIDCKIGDIDNTMTAYMNNLCTKLRADGVVINPYMGDDVFVPFMEDADKVGIVLVQTSNPQAKVIQELILQGGGPLWMKILELVVNRWNKNKNLIVVLSSNTELNNYESIRTLIPQDMPILLAGIGLQGGNHYVLKQLLNDNKRGVFVNSSRGILYPYQKDNIQWRNCVQDAVIELKNVLNAIRGE